MTSHGGHVGGVGTSKI